MNNHMIDEKRWNALRTALLTATAVMLVLSAVMGSAWAYFTTYCSAKGGHVIQLGHQETDDEDFSDWQKKLSITITEDSNPVYLRAKAFCADYQLTFSDENVADDGTTVNVNWVRAEDGWLYYTKLYTPETDDDGNVTPADPLYIKINGVPKSELEGAMEGDEFNVIIVYEAAEIQYDSAGNPLTWDKVDWSKKVDTSRIGGTSSESSDSGSTEGGEE